MLRNCSALCFSAYVANHNSFWLNLSIQNSLRQNIQYLVISEICCETYVTSEIWWKTIVIIVRSAEKLLWLWDLLRNYCDCEICWETTVISEICWETTVLSEICWETTVLWLAESACPLTLLPPRPWLWQQHSSRMRGRGWVGGRRETVGSV